MNVSRFPSVLSRFVACGATCFALASVNVLADAPTRISVYAGSGRAGLADGRPASAEFILPSALAADARGNLYVTDAAAQRVRVIETNGFVRTIAGSGPLTKSGLWVTPGFRDGRAAQAQFNRPAGIAVSANGEVYVADTNNHCIRLISGSIVSTYAGVCGTIGTKDGPRAEATFSYPRQLSLDASGNLYVADFNNGVRRVDADGFVTTVPVQVDKRVTGVQAISTIVYIADALGLLQYDAQTGVSSRFAASSQVWPPQTPGGVELGSPYALAVGGGVAGLFYTDLRTDSVHRWSSELVDYVSGVPREDAVLGDGWMTSTLHGPMGIALDVHGRLFVADSGHKRVVQITGFDRDTGFVEQPLALLQLPPKRAEYRILVIGNSFVWFDSTGRDSIGALVEKMLRDDNALKSIKQTPKVVSFHTVESISAQASLVKEIVSKSSFDFVIIIANANDFFGAPDLTAQLDLWHKEEADTVEALKAASIQSMFVLIPEHWMVTPLEVLYAREAIEPVDSDYASFEQPMLAQLQGIAPVLNLFPDIRAYEAAAFVKPLYANADLHPSLAGRAFIAQHIVKRLEELKPWSRSHR